MLQFEDRLISFLKCAKKILSTDLYKELYPKVSHPGITYVLAKIYKPLVNNFLKFRSIFSAINTGIVARLSFLFLF